MPVNDARKAVGMFKDEYLLDYINVEEMEVDNPEDVDEKVIEQAIVRNIKKFIMTFGRDFAYIGNQYHLEIVATYKTAEDMSEVMRKALPDIDEMRKLLTENNE